LLPQLFNLYNQQNYNKKHPGLTIDVMDMSDVTSVVKAMLGNNSSIQSSNVATEKVRVNPFLNGTSLLTKSQIVKICQLYKMDIDMLRVANNITTTICDEL
jgi:hypothetical protein